MMEWLTPGVTQALDWGFKAFATVWALWMTDRQIRLGRQIALLQLVDRKEVAALEFMVPIVLRIQKRLDEWRGARPHGRDEVYHEMDDAVWIDIVEISSELEPLLDQYWLVLDKHLKNRLSSLIVRDDVILEGGSGQLYGWLRTFQTFSHWAVRAMEERVRPTPPDLWARMAGVPKAIWSFLQGVFFYRPAIAWMRWRGNRRDKKRLAEDDPIRDWLERQFWERQRKEQEETIARVERAREAQGGD
jgi:hypothetical protein